MKIIGLTMAQQKDGKPYKKFTMEDGKKLSVFQFDSRYNDLQVDMDLADDLLVYDKTYDNYKLKSLARPTTYVKSPGGYKAAGVSQVMETKKENIKEAQDRKNEAIHKAGAFRDATLVVLASLKDQPFPTNEDFKREWEYWVKYFISKADEPFI